MSKLRFMPNYDEPSENLELYGDVYRYPLSTSLESSFEESARMEKDPFENVLLGGFILALGYKLGTAGEPEGMFSANLLQQTPLDQFLGDLLA